MMNENNRPPEWGARIEEGRVTGGDAEAGWTVESYDRPGLTAEGLAWAGAALAAGERVYFFISASGGGMILGKAG